MMHKDAQRKDKPKGKHASPRPRGGEGAGGAAPQRERAGGGTSTTGPSSQSFSYTYPEAAVPESFTAACADFVQGRVTPMTDERMAADQPKAQNSPKPNGNGDKTLGEHAQQMAERLYAGDMGANWTPNRGRPKADVARQIPSQALVTPEQQEAFAQAVVDNLGVKPACEALNFHSASVFYWAGSHPEFRKRLDAAQAAVFEVQVYKLNELCDDLLKMPPREMNQCANAYGRVFDYRMRIVGKLLPVLYGDRPGTQVNVQNNVGLVCDEPTRERLIALNQKILQAQTVTKELEQ